MEIYLFIFFESSTFMTLKMARYKTRNIWSFYQNILQKMIQNDSSQQKFVLMKTSWRRLSSSSSEDVLIKTNIFVLAIRLQDVLKSFWRHLQDVFKTSCKDVLNLWLVSEICKCDKFYRNSIVLVFLFTTTSSGCLQRRF